MATKLGLREAGRNATNQLHTEQEHINKNLEHIRHKILVLSGEGGVGKSTIAANPTFTVKEVKRPF